jgi:hypothetical protein
MDLVTLTDHDTVAGALEIASRPGTFMSEEVSCVLPGGRHLHVGVFGISEAQHEVIAGRRADAEALFAYLAEERIPAAVNHPFSALTGRRDAADLHRALASLELVEARNGMMSAAVNAGAARAGKATGRAAVGGSDAHTLSSVARAYTVVPDACDRDEFLDGLRRGLTVPAGDSGGYARLTADLARIAALAYGDAARSCLEEATAAARLAALLVLLPVLPLLPLASAAVFLHEQLFARRHERAFVASRRRAARRPEPSGPFGPAAATTLAR